MAIDWSLFAFPKGKPKQLVDHAKGVAAAAALAKCYAKVDARDEGRSWVSGKQLVKSDRNHDTWLTRHHLDGRVGEKRSDHHFVITVSWTEHQLLESSSLLPVDKRNRDTTDARKIHRFAWNRRIVEPGKEPFRLRGRKEPD